MTTQENLNQPLAAGNTRSRPLLLCVSLAAFFLVALLLPPYHAQGLEFWNRMPGLCPFHAATGLPCPGCGLTRSVVLCAHGLWSEAAWLHPLGPALFFGAFAALLYNGANALGLSRFGLSRFGLSRFGLSHVEPRRILHPWLPILTLASLLLVWLTRLIGWLPSPP